MSNAPAPGSSCSARQQPAIRPACPLQPAGSFLRENTRHILQPGHHLRCLLHYPRYRLFEPASKIVGIGPRIRELRPGVVIEVILYEALELTAPTAPSAAQPTPPTTTATTPPLPTATMPSLPTATTQPPPTAQSTATPVPPSKIVWVANTDGLGASVRHTPMFDDRLRAYPDRTPLSIIGDDIDGDSQRWHQVRAPDGIEGYIPAQYTLAIEPTVVATVSATPPRLPTVTPAPRLTATPPPSLSCGASSNPWGYNFCGRGGVVGTPPANLCAYFSCIPSFWNQTNGYVAQCADGLLSHSGGVRGACSGHSGVLRPLNLPYAVQ